MDYFEAIKAEPLEKAWLLNGTRDGSLRYETEADEDSVTCTCYWYRFIHKILVIKNDSVSIEDGDSRVVWQATPETKEFPILPFRWGHWNRDELKYFAKKRAKRMGYEFRPAQVFV